MYLVPLRKSKSKGAGTEQAARKHKRRSNVHRSGWHKSPESCSTNRQITRPGAVGRLVRPRFNMDVLKGPLDMLKSPLGVGAAAGLGCGLFLGWQLRAYLGPSPKGLMTAVALGSSEVTHVEDGGEYKMVLVIRSDLKMTKGKVAVQCSHAAVAAFKQVQRRNPDLLKMWESYGQSKVVVKAPDEDTLVQLMEVAKEMRLPVSLIQDAGRTQVAAGSRTVLSIGPGPTELLDSISGGLKLY
ncbi:peptidyl-tRNA hydrolase 2, mitochondrial isoform X2 [Phycodurus eques]|uniref:peptidyl-tRNA hydrolase 2, mitochondrial isoform X2 n=1 Tax=Phycodurus eques TaxID=693459 RepID=UPI002ACDF2AB|nr:peptidyl-tRNA hydrolase 2, mitochondrial isoform X2 [Phycodurus eques]